ncbi:prolipoprotein diacylglyceryl transferase [Aquimarina hainanensis]|uniref:Phosphatidylglycerol--prolipoprotein diacylglyceryl transferase n=1 Tax=Aquimarina hainanensis TaxID=1578017 RepID=A0ABW5N5F8_9FLAO|nr:prolipoprotein diacylglyceryl transferase [Aquimarina sp. TRL1]QKX04439.1 prolipoprotein diacylglyceryl transferase [Aquimarina sp. TRL1]
MGPIHWNIDPEITTLFGVLPLRYYGILFVAGILLAYQVIKKIYISENIPLKDLDKLATYILLGTLIGARLGHCIFYDFSYFYHHPLEIFLPVKITNSGWHYTGFSGLASHGAAIGILVGITLYTIKTKTSFLWAIDRVALIIPVTAFFIRIGNFMNSEIYGKPTQGNYGVIFMKDDLIPRHPTQLYEGFSYLIIFGVLWFLYKKKKIVEQKGYLFGLFLVLMFSARFIIEFFKENQASFEENMIINMGQLLSLPFIFTGIILSLMSKKDL